MSTMQTPTPPPNKRPLDSRRAAKLRRLIKQDGTSARIAERLRLSKFTVLGGGAEAPMLAPQREVLERYVDSIGEPQKKPGSDVPSEPGRDHATQETTRDDQDDLTDAE
jgi:hypothetical protein